MVMISGISVRTGSLSTPGMAPSGLGITGSGISLGSGRGVINLGSDSAAGAGDWATPLSRQAAVARAKARRTILLVTVVLLEVFAGSRGSGAGVRDEFYGSGCSLKRRMRN